MPDLITAVALAACWGTVIGVWCAGAALKIIRAPRGGIRDRTGDPALMGATALCAVLVLASSGYWRALEFDIAWVQGLGLAVLVTSTVFALWARFALGTAWSTAPEAGGDRRLHTNGPYGVTRHPIYTGLLGMILGSALLTGSGQVIIFVPVGLVLFTVKIHFEERLLTAMFPDEYPRYRRRVPRLVPGGSMWRQRDRG
jgi:protein-S-isoprenylcysteine O-methyltransferase Ste14